MIMSVQNVNMPSLIDNVFIFIYTSFLLRYGHFLYLSYCIRMFIFSKKYEQMGLILKMANIFFSYRQNETKFIC